MLDLVGNPEDRFSHVAAHILQDYSFTGGARIVYGVENVWFVP